jgi:hypothetical protein
MSLFDDLSSLSEWTASEEKGDIRGRQLAQRDTFHRLFN